MDKMFVFTMHIETKFYDKGDIIFSDKGETLGRVLRCSKIEIPSEKILYTYDVESTKEDFQRLENGEIDIWKVKEFSVFPCSTFYYRG